MARLIFDYKTPYAPMIADIIKTTTVGLTTQFLPAFVALPAFIPEPLSGLLFTIIGLLAFYLVVDGLFGAGSGPCCAVKYLKKAAPKPKAAKNAAPYPAAKKAKKAKGPNAPEQAQGPDMSFLPGAQ